MHRRHLYRNLIIIYDVPIEYLFVHRMHGIVHRNRSFSRPGRFRSTCGARGPPAN